MSPFCADSFLLVACPRAADDDAAVAEVCRTGIALAAAQSAAAGCRAVANRLQERLDALQSHLRDLPARQRSLRAICDDAWALLPTAEQRALAPLAFFLAACSSAAACAIAAADSASSSTI